MPSPTLPTIVTTYERVQHLSFHESITKAFLSFNIIVRNAGFFFIHNQTNTYYDHDDGCTFKRCIIIIIITTLLRNILHQSITIATNVVYNVQIIIKIINHPTPYVTFVSFISHYTQNRK